MRKHFFLGPLMAGIVSVAMLAPVGSVSAQTSNKSNAQSGTELLWLSQAGFRIKTPGGKMILIDP